MIFKLITTRQYIHQLRMIVLACLVVIGLVASASSPVFAFASQTTPVPTVPAGITLGSGDEIDFIKESSTAQVAEIVRMKADGVKWIRVDSSSTYANDTLIKDALYYKIAVSVVLQDQNLSVTPAAMAAFARAAALHYKGLNIWDFEVGNEPNGCESFVPAAMYVPLLKAAYVSIKAVDPHTMVIAAGLCNNSGSNAPIAYVTAMYAAGAHGYFDALNLHPYTYTDTPLQTYQAWNPWGYLPKLHAIMVSHGDGAKEIWLTEFGCKTAAFDGAAPNCSVAGLASQIKEAFASARSLGYIGPLGIFNWEDSTDGPWGLRYSDGTAKLPALLAFEAASQK
jgi:hypothetical protein